MKHITFPDLPSRQAEPPRVQPECKPGLDARYARGITLLYVALCILSLLPFVLIANPPIVDFANHAARLSIACNLADPDISAMYRYSLGWIPNLAVDVVNAPLCGVIGPAAVLKLVTAASLSLVYFSGWLIQRKLFGMANAFLLLLPALAFNLVTTMGYINFLAGVGIALLMVALAIDRETKFRQLMLICNAGGVLLFFCHIFALAFAMVFFWGLMWRDCSQTVRGFIIASLKPAALFFVPLLMVPLVPSSGEAISVFYSGKGRLLTALFMTPHSNPGILGSLFLIPLYLVIRNGLVEVSHRVRAPLIALAAYVLLVPSGTRDAVDIDSRTLVALAYLFFPAMRPARHSREISAVLISASSVILAFGLVSSLSAWRSFSNQVDELRQALKGVPARAVVLSVTSEEAPEAQVSAIAYSHLASYGTIESRIFNPLEFSGIGMQPLSSTKAYALVDTSDALPVPVDLALLLENPIPSVAKDPRASKARFMFRWPERFDYVIYYHHGRAPNFDPLHLTEAHDGTFFSILKVRKTPQL